MKEKGLILVVDDSPAALYSTCRILQKAGYETIEASTGMDGLRLTIEHRPDLVLLDVVLPDIYGYEVCRRIKEEANLTGTPVILISSLDTDQDHQAQGLEFGADGYITRPVSNRNLLAHIKSSLRLKAAEDNLRQSELKFRTVLDFTYDWEYWIAPDGGILYMSPSSERITGYQRDEFINNPELLSEIIHKDDRRNAKDHLNNIELSCAHIVDFRIITRNGEERWIAHQGQPIFDEGGKFLGRRVSNRDITERKRTEEALQESEEKFRQLFEKSPLGIIHFDSNGALTNFNEVFLEIIGSSRERVAGFNLLTSLRNEQVRMALESALSGKVGQFEDEYISVTGEKRVWLKLLYAPISNAKGSITGGLGIFEDITERKRMEEERLEMERKLLHAQKLESLAVMAGGIAHDFNNQLAVVLGNLELALLDLPPDSPARGSIMNAVKAATQSAQLSGQMRTYTGDTFCNPVELDLNELLNKNLNQLKSSLPKNVTFTSEIYNNLDPIKGDPDQIQRLAMNIVVNAAEAIGDQDGEVRLSTGVMDFDEGYLRRSRLEEQPEPGRFVFLEVRDTGCGMDSGTEDKLFDPFFTTKFWGRGIGMAEARGIVKGHGGAIIVDSEVGKGTTIRALFPTFKETVKQH
jgi:PAS domain S-box-containing protein